MAAPVQRRIQQLAFEPAPSLGGPKINVGLHRPALLGNYPIPALAIVRVWFFDQVGCLQTVPCPGDGLSHWRLLAHIVAGRRAEEFGDDPVAGGTETSEGIIGSRRDEAQQHALEFALGQFKQPIGGGQLLDDLSNVQWRLLLGPVEVIDPRYQEPRTAIEIQLAEDRDCRLCRASEGERS
jgi:hypothetical protein